MLLHTLFYDVLRVPTNCNAGEPSCSGPPDTPEYGMHITDIRDILVHMGAIARGHHIERNNAALQTRQAFLYDARLLGAPPLRDMAVHRAVGAVFRPPYTQ